MVDVLVGEEHELDVLECVPERGDTARQLVERRARIGPGVDQSQRVVLDQVDVDAPDGEGRGYREAMDAGRCGGGKGVVVRDRLWSRHDGK
jgi:hypothetical protein